MHPRSTTPMPSLREAVAQVIAGLDAPITRDDLVRCVLALHPSQARRPADLILAEVRQHTDLVRLEDGRYAAPDWILRGVRFRHVPAPSDSANGIVPVFPCFVPFLLEGDARAAGGAPPQMPTLLDAATGEEIAWEPFDLHGSLLVDGPGENAIHFQALNLRPWFRRHRFVPGDSLLLTIEDPRRAVFRLAYEAAADADRAAIAIQDATLESVLMGLIERDPSEQPFIEEIIPAALARLHEAARRYPGSHWHAVVVKSPRLRPVDDYGIARATFRRPIDRLFGYTGSPASEKELAARLDAYNADQARILEVTSDGMAPPPDAGLSAPLGSEAALRGSMRQIAAFLAAEGPAAMTEDRYRTLAVPSVYLAKHEGVSLADADYPMLCRFLLSYYPRRVLFNRKAFTGRMLASLRHFYEFAQPQSPLPPRLSRLHGLVDRKIALLGEIDLTAPDSARLFAQLFPDADKEDAEVITLAFRDAPRP